MAKKLRTNYSQDGNKTVSQAGSSQLHSRLINETLIYLGTHARHIGAFFRNETGMALNIRTEEKFKYGIVGSPDIYGITIFGYVGFECKTGNASQSDSQKSFQAMVIRYKQHYQVINKPEEALEYLLGLNK